MTGGGNTDQAAISGREIGHMRSDSPPDLSLEWMRNPARVCLRREIGIRHRETRDGPDP